MKSCYRLTHGLQDKLVLSDGQGRLDADSQLRGLYNTTGLHLHLERERQIIEEDVEGKTGKQGRKCREIKRKGQDETNGREKKRMRQEVCP